MRIGGINTLSTIDGDGVSYVIFFQGCSRRCEGCHNPQFQSSDGGYESDPEKVLAAIEQRAFWYDSVVFQGGEPLEQPDALRFLLRGASRLGLERWLYTGYPIEEVPADIVSLCSVIVAGEYVAALATGGFPASSNQTLLDRRRKLCG